MTRHVFIKLQSILLAAGLLLLLAPLLLAENETTAPAAQPSVRIGMMCTIFRDVPEPMVQIMLRPLKSLMEAQTGVTPQLVPTGDADTLGKQLADDKLQLGVFHGVEFGWARAKYSNLKPLMITMSHDKQLRAFLVVQRDSTIATCCDLKGKTVALPRRSKEHCHLFLERRCQDGNPAQSTLGRVLTPADCEEALDNVVDGVAAAAVVDQIALDTYQELKPARFAKLKIAERWKSSPRP